MAFNRRGSDARPLLESEIRGAQAITSSGQKAADLLGVHYYTYRKYAKMYGVFDEFKEVSQKGRKKVKSNPKSGKYPVDDILAGKYPNYSTFKFKHRLVKCGYKIYKCECCGYDTPRDDGKYPIILDYIDKNPKNKALENLRMLCYCCTFNLRGYVARGKREMVDPDWTQQEINSNKSPLDVDIAPEFDAPDVADIDDMEIDTEDLSEDEIKQLLGD